MKEYNNQLKLQQTKRRKVKQRAEAEILTKTSQIKIGYLYNKVKLSYKLKKYFKKYENKFKT